jgi:hypothetical protein
VQNIETQLLPSLARTTSPTIADRTNDHCKGVVVCVSVTSAGTGSITAKIQGKSATGLYYDILSSAAITTNSTNTLTVYPGITATSNVSASDVLPRTWRVVVTANNSNSVTYSVDATTIL